MNIQVSLLVVLSQAALLLFMFHGGAARCQLGRSLNFHNKWIFGASPLCLILVMRAVLGRVQVMEVLVGSKGCQPGVGDSMAVSAYSLPVISDLIDGSDVANLPVPPTSIFSAKLWEYHSTGVHCRILLERCEG